MPTLSTGTTSRLLGRRFVINNNVLKIGRIYQAALLKRHEPWSNLFKVAAVASEQDEAVKEELSEAEKSAFRKQRLLRKQQKVKEQATYQLAAIAASFGIGSIAVLATYFRFFLQLEQGEPFPYTELAATLLLVGGGMVGMEFYARWAHKYVWHDMPSWWALHKSHHEPRTGPFEANDIFAVMNAVPAMALCLYGYLRPDIIGGLCFGAGLGITLYGISYVFIHDGITHRRFSTGPITDLPVLRRIEVAHRIHHMDVNLGGVPYGLFLGPQELEAAGAGALLDKLVAEAEAKSLKAKEAAKASN